ncbi:hypothetical protein [Pelagibius sp. Alg239-R121]|uniref:hypothetical protein n=1 Tax=Pelagibius sp. Alg239-R121 TaxID=2993448 RepID=UPI0024A76D82|nr:hypothetical protein [Pelagibius sp. Alg239-R121]
MNTSSTPPENAVQSLAVIPSVTNAYRLVFLNLRLVPAAICLPALIYLVWYMVLESTGWGALLNSVNSVPPEQLPVGQIFKVAMLSSVVQFAALTLLYVAWHRLVLFGPIDGRPRFVYPIARRHMMYFAYMVLVTIIIAISLGVLSFIITLVVTFLVVVSGGAGAVGVLLVVPILFLIGMALLAKLSFVFPAVAVDENYGLMNAWKQSKGQVTRLVTGFILCFLPALIISVGLNWELFSAAFSGGAVQSRMTWSWIDVVTTVIGILNGLAVISYLSIAFQTCTGWVPEAPASQEVQPWES